jgi:DNA mismatch repair ATPase MutS
MYPPGVSCFSNAEYIDKLLQNFSPSEVLIQKNNKNDFKENFGDDYHCFYLEDWIYKKDYAFEILTKHFQTVSSKGWYCRLERRNYCVRSHFVLPVRNTTQ